MKKFFLLAFLLSMVASLAMAMHPETQHQWSDDQRAVLKSLWLSSLAPMPLDPSNKFTDDERAIELGKSLFMDPRLSGNKKVSCSTCHRPDAFFTDNLPLAHGMGTTGRRSMPLAGMAYSPWLFWDGRKDSIWSQALGPIESPVEHGISRTMSVHILRDHYRERYESIFGQMPDFPDEDFPDIARPAEDYPAAREAWERIPPEKRKLISKVYSDMGKAIGAYVRRIRHGESLFDRYVAAILKDDIASATKLFTPEQAIGLALFIGKAGCINCHNGPLLTNNDFHNMGISDGDAGRAEGMDKVRADEFNCLGPFSDAAESDCGELRFMDTNRQKYAGAFKTPSLRNVAQRPPYMHAGQFASIREVLRHYNQVASEGKLDKSIIHGELTEPEMGELEEFLRTLDGPVIAP